MQVYKIGNEADGSTEVAFKGAMPALASGHQAQAPTLDVIANGILSKCGIAPVQWQRYYQQVEEGSWRCVPEAQAATLFERSNPAFVATCTTNYTVNDDGENETPRDDAFYLSDHVWFDIDCDTPQEAINAVHRFVRKLEATGLDARCLRLYASGRKGFHVLVPLAAFVHDWWEDLLVAEMRWFPEICKEVATALYVDGVDMRVYSARRGRQLRRANVLRRDCDTYKVALTLEEFWSITPELYVQYVSSPRPAVATVPTETIDALGEIWNTAADKVQAGQGKQRAAVIAPVTDEKIERFISMLEFLPPDEDVENQSRHESRRQVISAGRLELGPELALPIIREWVAQSTSKDFTRAEWRQMFNSSVAKGGKVTTMGTLIARARRKGWADKWPHLNPKHDITVNEEATPTHLTEKGAVEFIARKYADRIRYVEDIGTWIHWTGKEWAFDGDGSCVHQVIGVEARRLYGQALKAKGEELQALPADADREMSKAAEGKYAAALKFYRDMESRNRIKGLKDLLPHEPAIRVSSAMLDRHPHLLNVDNGVLDLRTGELRPHDPALLLTQRAFVEYQPGAACPRWLRFVEEVSCDDTDLAAYLQCVIGYALSGDISRHEAYFLHGDGSNGKSVLVNTLRSLMGGYCKSLGVDAIMVRRDKAGPTPDLLAVRGARLVITSEMSAGRQLNEGVFKDLVSGDTITVRNLYSRHVIEMQFCCKVFMPTNTLPTVAGQDYGVWRRIRAIPFNRTFEGKEKDPGLESKLKAELSGILSWALEGYQRYKAQGFDAPAVVEDKTTEYREDLDVVKHFVADALVHDEQGRGDVGEIPAAILAQLYEHYCKTLNHPSMGGVRFGREVKKYLTEGKRFKSGWRYTGWRIHPEWLPAKLREEIPASRLPLLMDAAED